MRIKSSKEKRILAIKNSVRWFLYLVITLLCFIIMNSGTKLHPILLIPVAICMSTQSDELQSAFIGAFCGFLIDIACGKLFGYNAVILAIFCTAISLLYKYLLRQRFINTFLVIAAVSFLQGFLDFKFYYDIWGYSNVGIIFRKYTIPVCFMTLASSIVIYPLFKLINHLLMPKQHLSIEEAIKNYEE